MSPADNVDFARLVLSQAKTALLELADDDSYDELIARVEDAIKRLPSRVRMEYLEAGAAHCCAMDRVVDAFDFSNGVPSFGASLEAANNSEERWSTACRALLEEHN